MPIDLSPNDFQYFSDFHVSSKDELLETEQTGLN